MKSDSKSPRDRTIYQAFHPHTERGKANKHGVEFHISLDNKNISVHDPYKSTVSGRGPLFAVNAAQMYLGGQAGSVLRDASVSIRKLQSKRPKSDSKILSQAQLDRMR